MKVSDYIIRFLEDQGTTDIFGYPGVGCGHLMDSLSKSNIISHLVYHEQAAAFAACSYAQASHKVGIVYTTAGPGGTNLITGIANAYCDSIPTIFIVGDKDLSSLRNAYNVRQLASQEVDIVDIAKPITKWSYQVTKKEDIKFILQQSFYTAKSGRPGPVLLDIPSDIQRDDIIPEELEDFIPPIIPNYLKEVNIIVEQLQKSQKPVFLVGNGIKQAGLENDVMMLARKLNLPVVTTLVCFDLYPDDENYIGYIGVDGDKSANHIINEADMVLSLGARLNFKQVCNNRKAFASKATLIRVDVDQGELDYELRNEIKICADLNYLIPELLDREIKKYNFSWLEYAVDKKKHSSRGTSLNSIASDTVAYISKIVPEETPIVVDTGSHRRWVMSSFILKKNQRMYQSAGLVSMGYALPASVGVCIATKKPTICFDGDGGIMMNLQELQMIHRDQLPVTIIVMNNNCLGDIMEFQKKIFSGNFFTTTEETGYLAADFEGISKAFGLDYHRITNISDLSSISFINENPQLIEVIVPSNTR